MTFQSATSNIQVSQEPVIKVQDIPLNAIPTFDANRKMVSSGIQTTDLLTAESSIVNALIFG